MKVLILIFLFVFLTVELYSQNDFWGANGFDIVVYAHPNMIRNDSGIYTIEMKTTIIYKGEELLNKNRIFWIKNNQDTDEKRASRADKIDNINNSYLLFLLKSDSDTFKYVYKCYKIEKFWIWDFDSTIIQKRNLDSIFTYGFNSYYCPQLDKILSDKEKMEIKDKLFYQSCWFIDGISFCFDKLDSKDYEIDTLYLEKINCPKCGTKSKEFIIPYNWFNCRLAESLGKFE